MPLTIQSLYNSTVTTYRLKLIAGKNGVSRTASWMYYTEDNTTLDFIRGGEIIITTGMNIERKKSNTGNASADFTTEYLELLITKINELDASALIINIGRYINEIPNKIISLCDKLSLPLFTMPWEIHMIDIMQDYGNRIVTERQKVISLEKNLYDAMFHPEKFDKSLLEETSFSEKTQFGVILLEMPEELFILDSETITRYMEYSFIGKAELSPSDFCLFIHDHKIVFIVHDNPCIAAKKIKEASATDKYFKKMRVAFSNTCASINNLCDAYNHAELALNFYSKDEKLCDYNSLGIYKLLAEVHNRDFLESLYNEILGKLNIFSEEKRNDYLNTLKLYLESSGKIQKTADENYTHRNTVNYRIHKIEDALNIDLQNGDTRYMIQTALYIKELLTKIEIQQ